MKKLILTGAMMVGLTVSATAGALAPAAADVSNSSSDSSFTLSVLNLSGTNIYANGNTLSGDGEIGILTISNSGTVNIRVGRKSGGLNPCHLVIFENQADHKFYIMNKTSAEYNTHCRMLKNNSVFEFGVQNGVTIKSGAKLQLVITPYASEEAKSAE